MTLSRAHTSTKAQQLPLTLSKLIQYQIKHVNLPDPDFYLDPH